MTELRKLSDRERVVVEALLEWAPSEWRELMGKLDVVRVREMDDGGMGSLRFECAESLANRTLGPRIAGAEFEDEDGVPVSIVLNADQDHQLFELDVWKVNFDRLMAWPSRDALRFTSE